MKHLVLRISAILLLLMSLAMAQTADTMREQGVLSEKTFAGLKFRCIGPAFSSGRIADFAVNPLKPAEYYVGVACGNVWKTTNAGTTWEPIFDKYGSYSIASVVLDPSNPHVVWVGTGEYNSQRAIGFGDGVYRSEDGGKSFKNLGLKRSEHIGRIIIDPRNSHVYVAAQGPLWGPGGDRGLYKSTDNGKTWKKILEISDNTGITDIVMDPRNPDLLYAASYQRRRHVFTLINGGPESGIYKSIDAGATWTQLKSGLPGGDVGRIGLAISPVNPDVIYAIIEAAGETGGFFRSTNRGASWQKMSGYVSASPQYYNRIFADPADVDKVYSMDTITRVSEDGGKTFRELGNKFRHVDDHALWIDPLDTGHLRIGGDGGIYETFDNAGTWKFIDNLPVTQFYRVAVDNSLPFYYVYGGTQDNNSMGGPSQTTNANGISNADWFVTNGGDGFESQVDPENPDIVYAQSQYGGLVRYDKKSGESLSIKPQPPAGEAYRWNWNSPLIISPHASTRLYFAANKLFRSDDRGDTWQAVSPDLTRQIDRNTLPVMGRIQSVDAVSKNASTSFFGNIVALSESPLQEGFLAIGTDDGLIQLSEDGGKNWQKQEKFKDVPELTYVSSVLASQHDRNLLYATFDGRKNNDLAPHILKSDNRGKSWQVISANLPAILPVYTIEEDPVNPGLLFIGTELGVYFSIDAGKKWLQLKGGLPTIAVYDLAIQKRECDLVLGTFGRGIYILDDYSPLRLITEEKFKSENSIFPIKDGLMFIPHRDRSAQGHSYYTAENPPVGVTFTYYLKDTIETQKQKRQKAEKRAIKKGEPIRYPTVAELQAEDEEEAPYLLFTITDAPGNVIRRLKAPPKTGINRLVWDFRYPSPRPVREEREGASEQQDSGILALPGNYQVTMGQVVKGAYTELVGPTRFKTQILAQTTLPAPDRQVLVAFQQQAAELTRAVQGAVRLTGEFDQRITLIKKAIHLTPIAGHSLLAQANALEEQLLSIRRALTGDETLNKRNENQPPSISERVNTVVYGQWRSTSAPTQTMREQYRIAGNEFAPQLEKIKLLKSGLEALEEKLEALGAPWTPGRIPEWKNE